MEQIKMVKCPQCGYETETASNYTCCSQCHRVFWSGTQRQDTGSAGLDMTYIRGGAVCHDPFASSLQADTSPVQVKSPILAEASELIHGDRAKDYGDAKESFAHIAALWSAYTKTTISPQDVAMMMSLLKMSRAKHSGFTHRDSFVDMAGYVALASDIGE